MLISHAVFGRTITVAVSIAGTNSSNSNSSFQLEVTCGIRRCRSRLSCRRHGWFVQQWQRPAAGNGVTVLRDLVAVWQITVEVVLALEHAPLVHFTAQRQSRLHRLVHGCGVEDRQGSREGGIEQAHPACTSMDGCVRIEYRVGDARGANECVYRTAISNSEET